MNKKTSRFIFGLGLAFIGNFAQAQGLQGIVVEKFYKANAADVANAAAEGATVPLTTNSVTYRVYVDMAPGYKFLSLIGNANHTLKITSTGSDFYNDPNSGASNPITISALNTRKHTALLDSWMSVGAAATAKMAVLKSEDTDGSAGNAQGILQNNPGGLFGLPINIGSTTSLSAADGMIAGSPIVPNLLGFSNEFDQFDQTPGRSFSTNSGAIAALGGTVGATASNMICIGQFTTDGVFGFELNVQLQNISTGDAEIYVANNSQGAGETVFPGLTLAPNNPPTVSITAPSNGANIITGTALTLTANSSDPDASGSVTQVEFFVDGISVGVDTDAPYSKPYTAVVGNHNITAVSTDNIGDATTSSIVAIIVANNQAPTVSVSAATTAIVGDVVAISATAADIDGRVAQVEFFVDNASIGVDNITPFTMNWTSTVGQHTFKAIATDTLALTGTSANATIIVAANTPPTASITSVSPSVNVMAPAGVTINATATDSDLGGSVTGVEFFINGTSVGTDAVSPYSFIWTSIIGTAVITVKSTDNKGAVTTSSPVSLIINDPDALPYEVAIVNQICNIPTFNLAVSAALSRPVDNVIGYDVVLNYDKTKVTPTGNITVNGALIDASLVETTNSIDAVNGKMNISVYFKATAPAATKFMGTGKVFTVEFNKTVNFASVDTAIVTVPYLQESYITGVLDKATRSGKAITYKNYFFDGGLRFWTDNSAIKYDGARPNDYLLTKISGADVSTGALNAGLLNVSSDLSGNFTTDLRNGLAINIDRNIANATDIFAVVNAGDVIIGKSIILNDASVIPSVYQMIALDVNIDGVISAGDISQIKQRGAHGMVEYRQAWNYTNAGVSNGQASKDWMFVDSLRIQNNPAYTRSSTFPADNGVGFSKSRVPVTPFFLPATVLNYNNCPASTKEIYRGIMLGDVDGNYDNISNDGLVKSAITNTDQIVFDFSKANVDGNSVEIPVSIVSSELIRGLDFALKFNEEKLTFNEVVSTSSKIDGYSFYDTNDKTLRYTSDNMSNFDLNTKVVSVRFDLSKGSINVNDITSTMGMLNGKQVNVVLKNAAGVSEIKGATTNVNIFPNPTTGLLNIVASENSTVEITDLTGKQVLFQTALNANVKQEFNVSDFANGMYIVKVYNENFNSVERIVVNK